MRSHAVFYSFSEGVVFTNGLADVCDSMLITKFFATSGPGIECSSLRASRKRELLEQTGS